MLHLTIIQFARPQPPHPFTRQGRLDVIQQAAILFGEKVLHPIADRFQPLDGCQPHHIGPHVPFRQQELQTANADHREFIEIRCGDREKLQSLEQRDLLINGFIQHPLVKFQPA